MKDRANSTAGRGSYDAIVVGARCAGASTAMLLARKGFRVLLVDRATFPSEIPHGHYIHRHGPGRLADWGLLDRILETNCPPITTLTMDLDDFPLTGQNLVVDGIPLAVAPRRSPLDALLVAAAVEAGAELRQGFAVQELISDNGRVTGIRGRGASGSVASERASVVIGADGRNSLVARGVDAPTYESEPGLNCAYFSYWSGVPCDTVELYIRGRRAIFAHPTNDDLLTLYVEWPIAELPRVRADIESELMAVIDQVPDLADRVRAGRREERFLGATQLPNFLRKPQGPGWALVGDAGAHKDPFLALGVCDALRDAELLADALEQGLSRTTTLEAALAAYERCRNEATLPAYRENLARARFEPIPAEVLALRRALQGNQADTRHFYLAQQGLVTEESFFNPENIHRIMSASRAALQSRREGSPDSGRLGAPARSVA